MALSRPTMVRLLSMLISDISEECMSAGWYMGLEYILWDAMLGKTLRSRWDGITPIQRDMLRELSQELGGWVVWNPDEKAAEDTLFVSNSEWQKRYDEHTAKQDDRTDAH